MKQLTQREKRSLILLGGVLIVVAILVWDTDEQAPAVVQRIEDIPSAEKRLARLRQLAASVPAKQEIFAKVHSELTEREKGLIPAETAPQAQAQLLQILRRVARAQNPPIDLRNTEMGQIKPFRDNYGEVALSANFECGIEQLVNMLSDLTAQKELIGTSDLRIGAANPKGKTIPVRLTVSGLVRRDLLPTKNGASAF
jgi:hypothetical protein